MALLQTTFANPDAVAYGRFGKDVAMTDNYTVIGAPFNDNAGFDKSGAVYVYDSDDTLLYTLDSPNPNLNGYFGWSVAVTDTYLVVGAYRSDVVVNKSDAGAVYVFDTATGALLRTITSLTTSANWYFGFDVAIEGNIILIGEQATQTFGFGSGRAYVYEANTGTYVTRFNTPSAVGGANFGTTVAMDENWLCVHDKIGLGNVFIYDRATYTLQHSLTAPTNPGGQVLFGTGIAIENGIVIIGAPFYDEPSKANCGRAYVYEAATGTLLHTVLNPQQTGSDNFGEEVAISGKQFAVAAIGDDGGGSNTGTIYIFDLETATLLETIFNPNASPQEAAFGRGFAMRSLGLSNNKIVAGADVGAITNTLEAGTAYSFIASVPINQTLTYSTTNPAAVGNDFFGQDTDVSGSFYIVGAPRNDTGATDSGRAYIFDKQTGVLLHTLEDPNPAANNHFGESVSITDDYAVVGAYRYLNFQGAVYIYDTRTGVLLNTILGSTQSSFGWAISLRGTTLAIGAKEQGGTNAGGAAIYNVVTASLVSSINDTAPSGGLNYGDAIDTDGFHVVVGCPVGDDVHVFQADGTFVRVIASPAGTGNRFGKGVAVSGDYVVIGHAYFDDPGANQGRAYVYSIATGALLHTITHPAKTNSDLFGEAIDIDGTTIVIGAHENDTYGNNSGAAYFFDAATGEQTGTLVPPAPGNFTRYGYSVAINKQSVIVGQPINETFYTTPGSVYTYQLADSPFVDFTFRQELIGEDPGVTIDEVILTITDANLDPSFFNNISEAGGDVRVTTDIEGFDELSVDVVAADNGRAELKVRYPNYSTARRTVFVRAGNPDVTARAPTAPLGRNSVYPGYRFYFNMEETAGTVALNSAGGIDGRYVTGWPNSVVPGAQRGSNVDTGTDASTLDPELSAADFDVTQPFTHTFVFTTPGGGGGSSMVMGATQSGTRSPMIYTLSGDAGLNYQIREDIAGIFLSAPAGYILNDINVATINYDTPTSLLTYYINGVQVASQVASNAVPIGDASLGNLRIGGGLFSIFARSFNGDMFTAALLVGRTKSEPEMLAEAGSITNDTFWAEGQSELISGGGGGGASGLGIFAFMLRR